MENKEFGKLLEVRTKNFALEIIKLSAQILRIKLEFAREKQMRQSIG